MSTSQQANNDGDNNNNNSGGLFGGISSLVSWGYSMLQGEKKDLTTVRNEIAERARRDEKFAKSLVTFSVAWASLNGMLLPNAPKYSTLVAPISLVPFPFPRVCTHKAVDISPLFNLLYLRVSEDYDWLQQTLANAGKEDADFTGRLLKLHQHVISELKLKKKHRLAINRSDYMLHSTPEGFDIRQVEMNTIAASFGGLSSKLQQIHNYLNDRVHSQALTKEAIPMNLSAQNIPATMARAFHQFGDKEAVIVFVVQPGEKNFTDQYILQQELETRHKITTVRLSLAEIEDQTVVDEKSDIFINNKKIALFYMRAGYTPNDYPTEKEWSARLKMEKSTAIVCPDIGTHLAGAKKVQQELARPGVLERFFPENDPAIASLRSVFAGLYSFDKSDSEATINRALSDPSKYVLKPQREGGGNNLYDSEMVKMIEESKGTTKLEAYILMERLFPPTAPSVMLRKGKVYGADEALPEFGTFGGLVITDGKIVMNDYLGFLIRSKFFGVSDGGIITGNAYIDGLFLI